MGANFSAETLSSVVDPMFGCPVCYEKYKGHIVVCGAGHAVCESCSRHLQKCPQCNAGYSGTRNYSLEDIVTKLKQINCTPEQAVERIVEKGCAAVLKTSEATQRSIPIPPEEEDDKWLVDAVCAMSSLQPFMREAPFVAHGDFRDFPKKYDLDVVRQMTFCRIEYCRELVALEELEQHLLSQHRHHVRHLTSEGTDAGRCNFSFNLECRGHRFALLTDFGIFFLIIDIDNPNPLDEDALVTSWIQGVCSNDQSSLFNYTLNVEMNDIRATYQDYVHGCQATASHIRWKHQCLGFFVYAPNSSSLKVQGSLTLNDSITSQRRSSNTTIEPIT